MSQRRRSRLGDLQLAILSELWQRREATVAEVHAALRSRGLALTTVGTMLRKMEARGLVGHRSEGRVFVYRAVVREHDVRRSMLGEVIDRMFEGNPTALVSRLLRENEFAADELSELRALIDEREAELVRDLGRRRREGGS